MEKTRKKADSKQWQWKLLIPLNCATLVFLIWFLGFKPYPVPVESSAYWQGAKESRKVDVGIENGSIVAKCWVPFDPDEFAKMLLDVEHYHELFPTIPMMKQLSASDRETAAAGTLRALGPVTVSFSFDLKAEPLPGGDYLLKWDGTGTGLGANTGTWELRRFEGGSAVVSRMQLIPDGKLVPLGPWNRLMVPFVRHSLSFLGVQS